jgi:hypothetical protein
MPKGPDTKTDILKVCLTASYDPAWRTNSDLYLALHTGDPSAGTQATAEATYISYDRVAIPKSAVGWTIVTDTAQNAQLIQCIQSGGTVNTITHVSIGVAAYPTAGQIIYCGSLTTPLIVNILIQPQFAIHAITIVEG